MDHLMVDFLYLLCPFLQRKKEEETGIVSLIAKFWWRLAGGKE